MWFKGVYSTARVVAVRQLICGKRGRSLGTCRAEGAKYFLPIALEKNETIPKQSECPLRWGIFDMSSELLALEDYLRCYSILSKLRYFQVLEKVISRTFNCSTSRGDQM